MEFEWTNFPGFTTLQILAEIQKLMTESMCELEQIQGRIILMSMCNDIVWGEEGNNELCIANSFLVAEYARRNAPGHWSFLGPAQKSSGTEVTYTNQMENGTKSLILWWWIYSKSGHPVVRGSSAFGRGDLRAKENNKCPYNSMAATKPSRWFFVQWFPSISSVSTEQ